MNQRMVIWSLVGVLIVAVLGLYIYTGMQLANQEAFVDEAPSTDSNTPQENRSPNLNSVAPMTEEERASMVEMLNSAPAMTEEERESMLQQLNNMN